VATERADEFIENDDMAGSAVWRRVRMAVEEIRREEPNEGEVVN